MAGDTERKTAVDICILSLKRDKQKDGVFDFNPDLDQEVDFGVMDQQTGLVKRDLIGQLVKNYQEATEAFKDMTIARAKLASCVHSNSGLNDMIKASFDAGNNDKDVKGMYNHFVDSCKESFWSSLFTEGKFNQFMTRSVVKDFHEFSKSTGNLSFSEANIHMILSSLFDNRVNILKKNIEEVFDILTSYHKDNRCYFEGWKTNDRWKVKKKFILPMTVSLFNDWNRWHPSYYRTQELRDIDIAMCSLTGKNMDDIITINRAIEVGCSVYGSGEWETLQSEFFKIKCYKKGTGHFEFLDEDLYNKFNIEACGAKKWLCT
jgi:hypothetical protein